MNKKFKIILIIAAALIVLAIAAFFILKDIRAKNREPDMPGVTLFKFHIFKTLTDEDITEIKEIVKSAAGDIVLDVYKSVPLAQSKNEAVDIDVGDLVNVTCSLISTDEEKMKIMTALLTAFNIDRKYWEYIHEIK